jgi:hypothetical protein
VQDLLATIAFFISFIVRIYKDCSEMIIFGFPTVDELWGFQTIEKDYLNRIGYWKINHCNSTRLVINSLKIAGNSFKVSDTAPLNAIVYKVNAHLAYSMLVDTTIGVVYFGKLNVAIIAIAILPPFLILV